MKLRCNFVLILLQTNSILTKAYGQKYDYIGCFQWVRSPLFEIHDDVEDCAANCKFTNPFNNMIGLKNGRECHCVSGVSSAVASWRCNMFCKNFSCGGVEFYSVYKIQPRQEHDIYYCHVHPENSENAIYSRNFDNLDSLEMCAHFCLEMNMTFFRKTIFYNKCNCFQEVKYALYFRSADESFHAVLCSKNEAEICEYYFESLRNLPTIFSTRLFYEFQRGVSTFSHCKTINYEIQERCPEGCSEGWKGDSCRERDCTRNNGDCGDEMKCIESTVNGNKYVECVCPLGTVRNKWYLCEVFRKNVVQHNKYIGKPRDGPAENLTKASYNGFLGQRPYTRCIWIAVALQSLYSVGYLRVYGRLCHNNYVCRPQDGFVARLSENTLVENELNVESLKTCGYGPEKAKQAGNPMTIICEDFALRSRYVILHPSDEKFGYDGFFLSLLEVYEVSCGVLNGRCEQRCTESKDGDAHVVSCSSWTDEQAVTNSVYGCYLKVSGDLHFEKAGLSYMQCRDACTLMSKSLAVMQAGFKCYCSSNLSIAGNIPVEDCKKGHYRSNLIFDDCLMLNNFCEEIENSSHSTRLTTKINHTDTTETLGTIVIINPSNEQPTATSSEETDDYEFYKEKLIIAASVSTATFLLMLAAILGHIMFTRRNQKSVSQTSDMSSVSSGTSGAKSPDDILESVNRQLTEHE
ncbi:hypothetical protein HELRODRAFT_176359 [Helobdella robusta]|uniref:WSC domain-containing protein n=1 Tax=Helobdella robusta TaxID=6412 RepID=T1FAG0_HELRO|nr:hypothetical protein HELRODRAFT_176359 [Helobdella robusta]ESO00051.1 hypothetical protein HELRODRAFT_176359 [Helobdella robusta]